jgi:calcium-dependent protein kinase
MLQLFDIITSHEIDYDEFEKLGVSSTAVDFLRKVLTKNPHDRLTAAEALEHPWFKVCC